MPLEGVCDMKITHTLGQRPSSHDSYGVLLERFGGANMLLLTRLAPCRALNSNSPEPKPSKTLNP